MPILLLCISCKKTDFKQVENVEAFNTLSANMSSLNTSTSTSSTCVDDLDNGTGYDTILKPTILGYRLVNQPYSLAKMQQAYTNLYGNSNGVGISHKYVRFKPSSPQQLSVLIDMDIDLFDYPLDYEVVQEGDYYNDGITPAEEIPWLYAVIEVNFLPPSGITYEVLEQIHIPILAAVENEAFRITGNPKDESSCTEPVIVQSAPKDKKIRPNNALECPPGYYWDAIDRICVPDNGSTPPPAPSRLRQPSGVVNVFDNTALLVNRFFPVRNARIVAKRYLKVERGFTNNQGQFALSKEFNKAHIILKFKNEQAIIRALKRARLWQMLLPVTRNIGRFRGSLNNLIHDIPYNADALSDGARDWVAATAHNNVQEYHQFAIQQRIGTPQNKIRILLTNWRLQGVRGAAPMYAKRVIPEMPEDFLRYFLIHNYTPLTSFSPWLYVLKQEVDITGGYNLFRRASRDETAGSDEMSEMIFHELTHAAHYNKVGNAWWNDFVDAQLNNIMWPFADNPPYGNGNQGARSQIIATGESWGYYMGHFMADLKYLGNSDPTFNQGISYLNREIWEGGIRQATTGLNAHINLLEDFDNHRPDADAWIPTGLYYDLFDDRNDNNQFPVRVPLDDQVMNYTNEQFFNALDPDIRSLPAFRMRLLNENGNNQDLFVNRIFTFYNVF